MADTITTEDVIQGFKIDTLKATLKIIEEDFGEPCDEVDLGYFQCRMFLAHGILKDYLETLICE